MDHIPNSVSPVRSPQPTSVVSYQSSSHRLPSPLNPTSNSFRAGYTPRNSPVGEMSDTLSPLKERLELSLTSSPRPRTSSISCSPSSRTSPEPQQHCAYAHHPGQSSSPFAQGMPFPGFSPLPSSPLAAPSQSRGPRPFSPSNSPKQGSPIPMCCTSHPVYSLPRPTQSYFHVPHSSPVQIIPSPSSRFPRTQSLIQQSFGNSNSQIASSPPGGPRIRRGSLGAESRPKSSVHPSTPTDKLSIQDVSTATMGDSTPYAVHFPGGEFNDAMNIGPFQPVYGHPSVFRESFRYGVGGPGAFLDDEIRASFGDVVDIATGFADAGSVGVSADCGMEGIPIPRVVPVQMAPWVTMSRTRNDGPGVHTGPVNDGTTSACAEGLEEGGHGRELTHGRDRRFSNASTHSSTSYVSCLSGHSQLRSRSLLMTSSQSRTSTCPSLYSLGIGIEEAEREEHRSRTFWRRRDSESTLKRQSKDTGHGTGEHNEDTSQSPRTSTRSVCDYETGKLTQQMDTKEEHVNDGDTAKHGSFLSRAGPKHGSVQDEQAEQAGYSRAEKCVAIATMSILPAATVTSLSPFGEALVKARESVKFASSELAPVLKDTLAASAQVLAFAPLPGLEDAAKTLLLVWDACQKVDTNRLSCLRLVERCATLLYSVQCDVDETGVQDAIAEPLERLHGVLTQIETFLHTQLHRPFLKRYVRREEIARELQACNDAITDAASRFGLSVQCRTYREVCAAMYESKRYAQEAQALLSLDQQIIQRQFAMLSGQQMQLAMKLPVENALGLSTDGTPVVTTWRSDLTINEGYKDDYGYPIHPPAYGPTVQPPSTIASHLPPLDKPTATRVDSGSGEKTSTPPILSSGNPSDASMPFTPTKAEYVVEETKTEIKGPMVMKALKEVHRTQDAADAAVDEAALRGTMAMALDSQNDRGMVRCLQVAQGEIPEAAETLRRILGEQNVEVGENQRSASERREHGVSIGTTELDRKFMQRGIEAMTRLTGIVAEQSREGNGGDFNEGAGTICASELPSRTITRYEVNRTRKIGASFFSDVYLAHWREFTVIVQVLVHSVSRETFMQYVKMWNALDHPNVLPLYGASSAVEAEKPWFLVSKFCNGDNLPTSLRRAKFVGELKVENKVMVCADPLRIMHEVAEGMAYLHRRGVLHGDLRAANVLVDENGQCVLSDFGQCGIKSEAHQSCGQPESHRIRWKAPEMLMSDNQPTNATDVYAFAICCVEILGMGDLPWQTLDDEAIRALVIEKDERPSIPVPAGYRDAARAVRNLVELCWVREPELRPVFASIATSLEEIRSLHGQCSPKIPHAAPSVNSFVSVQVTSTESSPTDEQYETASESMRTEGEEEIVDSMTDVSLTSPVLGLGNGSAFHAKASYHTEVVSISTQVRSGIPEHLDDTPTHLPTKKLDADARNEENYRSIAGSNHTFHKSLTLPLWSPTRTELGAVGYLSKPKGEFITLFNALDPLQSYDERLRQLPSMYGYGKFEIHKREEGKRSVAQRGLDVLSGFLTFRTRGDRSHPERIARQYAFPLVQGRPSAHLCVEKTVHRYMDHLEAPMMWFRQHVELILEVCASCHAIQKEDLILVVGTLDATDWAVFASTDHIDGRGQFNVFANREKGEPWGMYTVEPAVKSGDIGSTHCVDVSQGPSASKVSCVTVGGNDVGGDTVMLAGLQFEQGMETPTMT